MQKSFLQEKEIEQTVLMLVDCIRKNCKNPKTLIWHYASKSMSWEIKTKKTTSKEVNIRNYAKYILLKGNVLEKGNY